MVFRRLRNNKWFVLSVCTLAMLLALGTVYDGVAVLLPEIATDLGLSYAQVGLIWGAIPIGIALFTLAGGLLGDWLGTRVAVGFACFLGALSSFLRGLAPGLAVLAAFTFLFGISEAIAEANIPKTAITHFGGRSLGLVNGILGAGFCTGAALSSMSGATWLSPWLGGWRGVLYLYGGISVLVGLVWVLTIRNAPASPGQRTPVRQVISRVFRSRDIWLDGIALFMVFFAIQGVAGYMPVYFQNVRGMDVGAVSRLVSAFIWVSIIGTLGLPLLSDRIGRKAAYLPAAALTGVAIFLLPRVSGPALLAAVVLCGVFGYGGAFVMHYVVVAEAGGIAPEHYGTAFGLLLTIGGTGGFLGPLVGGAIADSNPSLPFTVWALALIVAIATFSLMKGSGRK